MECVSHRPKFLATPPPCSEPFYVPEHEVISPKIRSVDGNGTTVYIRPKGPGKYVSKVFYMSVRRGGGVGGNKQNHSFRSIVKGLTEVFK